MLARSAHISRTFVFLLALASLFIASSAFADRVKWKKTTVSESNESWRLDLEFHMSRAPDIAHVPMRFEFVNTVYYERSLVDGKDEPTQRMVPMENKQPLVESVDVGFLDPGSGKTQSRTRFTFKLTRDRGFEAGEYNVTVINKRSGGKLGAPTRLILNGDNEVIDRRSMVFDDKKPKKKKQEAEESTPEPDPVADPNSEEYWSSGPTEPEAAEQDLPPPAHLQDKPGACGCRVSAPSRSAWLSSFLLLGVSLLPLSRRLRRR